MPRILVAPLDWGLGHATRCIPIIQQLQKQHCEVIIAAEGASSKLLYQEFSNLTFIHLRGYRIRYSSLKRFFSIKILLQVPAILKQIRREHKWLKEAIATYKIDAVISDNRYGLYSNDMPCIFITHQLEIQMPFKWIHNWVQQRNYSFINRFTECWVPDFEVNKNMAGALSHPIKKPSTIVKYIGMLSRFEMKDTLEKKYEWLIILSGPEPQRSLLEKRLLKDVKDLKGSILIVRGKPGSDEKIEIGNNCTIVNHLDTKHMQKALTESKYIISRSGYTTVMEVLSLHKQAILIPTPGQSEQEYLAKHLMNQGWCYTFKQNEKNYLQHFEMAKKFIYDLPFFENTKAEDLVKRFVENISRL